MHFSSFLLGVVACLTPSALLVGLLLHKAGIPRRLLRRSAHMILPFTKAPLS
jgi:hypothetical protein